ncbi:hypothetical protein ABFS83_02G125600 [Erythranthe nasuta]
MAFVHHSLNLSTQPRGILLHGKSINQVVFTVRCEISGADFFDHEENSKKKTKKKMKILIAGGGIGGLVYALAAKRSGFDFTVFEKDMTTARGEGRARGPIQLSSSGLNLLQSIDKDVTSAIIEACNLTSDAPNGIADGLTGQWLAEIDFRTPAKRKGIPVSKMICRVELQRILLNAVGEDNVMNKSKVVDFVSDSNKVTVFLENGEQYEGDVLVGADGLRSVVRSKLFGPNNEPKNSKYVCYTGVQECLPAYLPRFGYKFFLGYNKYLLAVDIGKGRMQWYALVKNPPVSSQGYKKMLLERYGDWCKEVTGMISRTEEDTIIRRPIYDIDMMNTWGKGRVVLLGDAAHAMQPYLGQGSTMAIEDCYWLMVELQNVAKRHTVSGIPLHELTSAFRRYEDRRKFRVTTIHTICRLIGDVGAHYKTYLFDTGPIQLFNVVSAAVSVKDPVSVTTMKLFQLALPTIVDWVIANPEP